MTIMKKTFSKILAIVLTVAMIQGTGSFFSFADSNDAAREAESAQPKAAAEEQAAKTEEPGSEDGSLKVDLKEAGGQEAQEAQSADGESGQAAEGEQAQAGEQGEQAQDPATEEAAEQAVEADDEAGQAEAEADKEDAEKDKKTTYEYSDDRIAVTATVADASAVPDSAKLVVTPVTEKTSGYSYDAYMDALNSKAKKGEEYTADNTLLYDIAFIDDGKEIQPEKGAVDVSISFKAGQLTKKLDAEKAGDVEVTHLPIKGGVEGSTTKEATGLSTADIRVESVDADVSVGKSESASFETTSFSVWAFNGSSSGQIEIKEPETKTFKEDKDRYLIDGYFGELANFGLVAFDTLTQNQHIHSNLATNNLVIESNGEVGRRQTNTMTEVIYIGNSITCKDGMNGTFDMFVPGSQVVLGYELGQSGKIDTATNDKTYQAEVGGVRYQVNAGESASAGGSSSLFRVENKDSHYIDLEAMKQKAQEISNKLADRTASAVNVTHDTSNQ